MVELAHHRGPRLDSTSGHATPNAGEEPQPRVVLGKDLEWSDQRVAFKLLGSKG